MVQGIWGPSPGGSNVNIDCNEDALKNISSEPDMEMQL